MEGEKLWSVGALGIVVTGVGGPPAMWVCFDFCRDLQFTISWAGWVGFLNDMTALNELLWDLNRQHCQGCPRKIRHGDSRQLLRGELSCKGE